MKKLLSVSGFSALLTLLRMLTGFVIAKVIAIYTGPTGMAMLGQVQSLAGILSGVVNAPAGTGLIRYTAENIDQGYDSCSPWWRASLQWIVAILLFTLPAGLLLSKPLSTWLFETNELYWLVIILCCTLPFSAVSTLVNSVINGQQQFKRYISLGIISNIISTILMIALVYTYKTQGALIAAAISSGVTGCVVIVISLRQPWFKLKYWWGKVELEHRKRIGDYILMALTSALTAPVALIVVRNILVTHVGWDSAGLWQAVWKISEVYLSIITLSLGTYYLPKLSSLKTIGEIRAEVNQTALLVMPIVVISALCVYFFRDIAIKLLFTENFRESRSLFAIQLIGDVIKVLSWLYAFPMLSRGTRNWFVSTEIVFSLLFITLTYFFVNLYGVDGANIAYLLNYILYFFCVLFFFCRRLK